MSTRFSTFNPTTNDIEENYDVEVSYGNYFTSDSVRGPDKSVTSNRTRAILFSKSREKYATWKWSKDNKVHFICHSQGGNTVRYLISLMKRGAIDLHPVYFDIGERDYWTVSVTTLGTPHKGTTIINVLENFVSVCIHPSYQHYLDILALIQTNYRTQLIKQSNSSQDHLLLRPSQVPRKGLITSN